MVSCSYQSQEQLSVNSSKFILTYTEFMGGDRYTSFDCCKFQCLLSIFTETSHNLEAYWEHNGIMKVLNTTLLTICI